MITHNEFISNNLCQVTFNHTAHGIIIQTPDFIQQRIFGGYPELLERFREFTASFSEHLSFEDACKYFTLSKQEHEAH